MVKKSLKIGLFVCDCGTNIAGVLNIEEIKNHFATYPDIYVFEEKYLCAEMGLNLIANEVKEKKIERAVIAACSFKLHGELFRNTIEKTGINRFLVSFANIREQNSWVHANEPKKATQKAIDQIDMALERVKLLEPLERKEAKVEPSVLVIGGGIAGIKASLQIADAGYKVYLVEREPTIGGKMALLDKTFPTLDCSICILGPIMVEVKDHPNIDLMAYSELKEVSGYIGNFNITIEKKPRFVDEEKCVGCFELCKNVCPIDVEGTFFPRKAIDVSYPQAIPLIPNILEEYCTGCKACEQACGDRKAIDFSQKPEIKKFKVGAIIVSTGFKTFDPSNLSEYNYKKYTDVITGMEMERLINTDGPTGGAILRPSDGLPPKNISFILCVGSRNKKIGREYCSQVCCNYSIKQAILAKKQLKDLNITIYYTDIRAVGKFCEEFFNRAQEEFRIRFIKSNVSSIVKSDTSNKLLVRGENVFTGKQFEDPTDLVVLAVGSEPPEGTEELANMLNISTDTYGFLLESHLKVRPSDSSVRGIYIAGAIQSPKDIPNSIAQAESAAAKSIGLLTKGKVDLDPLIVRYNKDKCDLCRLCENVCEFAAIKIDKDAVHIIDANCVGCGACTAMCHTNALEVPGFTKEEILKQIEVITNKKKDSPLIVAFLCNWCSYLGADLAGTSKIQYPTNIRSIHVMCTAMLDPSLVFEALFNGADGVLIAGCHPQDCHYISGFKKAENRYESITSMLKEVKIKDARVKIISISAGEGQQFADAIKDFSENLRKMGPITKDIQK